MMTAPTELLSSSDVCERVGLTYRVLFHWVEHRAITPTVPARGPGSQIGWTTDDVDRLQALAAVRRDLLTLGLRCPPRLIGLLWEQLTMTSDAGLHAGIVTIQVRRELASRSIEDGDV